MVAAQPVNDSSLNICCTSFPCDLILLSPEENDLKLSRKNYSIAYRRGVFFEIQYASMITDSTYRKKVIIRSHKFQTVGKLKNIIITSNAQSWMELRSPYDVANLGLLFGLSEEQSKGSISILCRNMLLKAEGRRHGKTIIYIKQGTEMQIDDQSSTDNDDTDSDTEMSDNEDCPKKKIKK